MHDSATRHLERAASLHNVDELRLNGIEEVKVLRESDLDAIARIAVRRALRDLLGPVELSEDLRRAVEMDALDECRDLLDPASDLSEVASPTTTVSREDLALFQNRMLQSLTSLVESDWRRDLEEVESNTRHRLEVFERRIGHLVEALEATDHVIDQLQSQPRFVRATAADGEEGTPLDATFPLYEKKAQLLEALFQANLELRAEEDRVL